MHMDSRCRRGVLLQAAIGLVVTLSTAQPYQRQIEEGRSAFSRGNYTRASDAFLSAGIAIYKDEELTYDAGRAHLEANRAPPALDCFEALLRKEADYSGLDGYLARAYHHSLEFDKAIVHYKRELRTLGQKEPRAQWIRNELLRCSKGMEYKRRVPLAFVESAGRTLNTSGDEFAPCPSVQYEGKCYFSAVPTPDPETGGAKKAARIDADLYYASQTGGSWQAPVAMHHEINSALDEEILDFGMSGGVLFFSRQIAAGQTAIYSDTFRLDDADPPAYQAFEGPLLGSIGDGAMSMFQDSIVVFASARTGGYGANDLYLAVRRNGRWYEPVNLGPEINGPFNEHYPHLSSDGLTLYFSSDRLESMGGYDVFRCRYLPEANRWTAPENLGIPVNSAADDTHFRFTGDALAAVFSSNRKMDNQGQRDIYLAYFTEGLTDGPVVAHGSPLGALYEPAPEKLADEVGEAADPVVGEELLVEALFYRGDDLLSEPTNRARIDRLVRLLLQQSDAKVRIIGHAFEESQDPINLYYSIKIAERVADYLASLGIAPGRISCFGVGSSYPLARPLVNGHRAAAADKLNRRVEFQVDLRGSAGVRIRYLTPEVPSALQLENASSFEQASRGLYYSLYLGEAGGMMSHPLINFSAGPVVLERRIPGVSYACYAGHYSRFSDAKAAELEAKSRGIPTQGIRAGLDGHWLERHEIIDHVLQHPELLHYMEWRRDH